MLKKIFLPFIFAILGYGFWLSPNFKEIAAGVAIFLFGMISLEEGFKVFTGGSLEKVLKSFTSTRLKSMSFGIITTSIMQSSSLVSVITISFLSAGLIKLGAGIGIIFGANLGTTTGAWLVAGLGLKVKISAWAMPMLVFGVILLLQKNKNLKGFGYILAGLGFLFLGIHHMKEGFDAFKDTLDLTQFAVEGFLGLILFSLIGMVATVIMQSSHATLVLIITALAAGQISYENALALAIGANVGTTITAVIGAISASIEGKRLAGAHLIFNLVTGAIAIIFIGLFRDAVDFTSAAVGIANDDYTLKLAVFHSLFNLVGVVVMMPFINPLVHFLTRRLRAPKAELHKPKYLTDAAIDFPDTAFEAIRKESLHLLDITIGTVLKGISLSKADLLSKKPTQHFIYEHREAMELDVDKVYEQKIKSIYAAIVLFMSRSVDNWDSDQMDRARHYNEANRHLIEAAKDLKHLHKNMSRMMNSSNSVMRSQYDHIRLLIAIVCKALLVSRKQMKKQEIDDETMLTLDTLKVSGQQLMDDLNKQLIDFINDGSISPLEATSLMNDNKYCHTLINNLVDASMTLLSSKGESNKQVIKEVALDSFEIEQIARENKG